MADTAMSLPICRWTPRFHDCCRGGLMSGGRRCTVRSVGTPRQVRREWEDVLITGPAPGIIEAADRVGHPSLGAERRHHRGG